MDTNSSEETKNQKQRTKNKEQRTAKQLTREAHNDHKSQGEVFIDSEAK
jgi:hypothetical protein